MQYFNNIYQRTGTFWEGRYKATLIDSEHYALGCYQYIELNPVWANMVEHPAEYPWFNYRFNVVTDNNELVVLHVVYKRLGRMVKGRREAYKALFDVGISQKMIEEIREATNKSWVLGSDYFKKEIEHKINRPMNPSVRGGDRKSDKYKCKNNSDYP